MTEDLRTEKAPPEDPSLAFGLLDSVDDQKTRLSAAKLISDVVARRSNALATMNCASHIDCLDIVAEAYIKEGKYRVAEIYYARALQSRLENFDIDSWSCAKGMHAMGKICYFQKRYSEAECYIKEYIRICTKRRGFDHPDVAFGWRNIVAIFRSQGRLNYAKHACLISLRVYRETLGEDHLITDEVKRTYADLLRAIEKTNI